MIEAVRQLAESRQFRALGAYFKDAWPIALDGDVLRLQFAPRQRYWLEYCEGSDRAPVLAETVGRALGRRVSLRFELAAAAEPLDANSDPTRTRALREEVDQVRNDPMVAAVLKMFDGRIVHVDKAEMG